MSDPLSATLQISGAGLRAQSERLRVVSENLATPAPPVKQPAMIPIGARPLRSKVNSTAPSRPTWCP